MKVARSFASLTMTGTARAEPIADAENGVTGWKLSTREHPELVVLKSDLVTGVRSLCADAQKMIEVFLGRLKTLARDNVYGGILQQHIFRQEADLESAISKLPMAFFGRAVAFENGKSSIQFTKHVLAGSLDNPLKRKKVGVYGKLMGTTFFLNDNTTLDSCSLSEAVGIYFSVFQFVQVLFLERLIDGNQLTNIDFGKLGENEVPLNDKDDAKILLMNQMTKLTSNIRIYDNVIAKPLHNWEVMVQTRAEIALGVPAYSTSVHT
jgi:hypothetical protein